MGVEGSKGRCEVIRVVPQVVNPVPSCLVVASSDSIEVPKCLSGDNILYD